MDTRAIKGIRKNYVADNTLLESLKIDMHSYTNSFLSVFLTEIHYFNPDGKFPKEAYMIEDDSVFNEFCSLIEQNEKYQELQNMINTTANECKVMEEQIVAASIAIAPVSIQNTLKQGSKTLKYRNKLIDLFMRADETTFPKEVLLKVNQIIAPILYGKFQAN